MDNPTNQTAMVNLPENQSGQWNGDISDGSSPTPTTPSIDGDNTSGTAWTSNIGSSTTSSLVPDPSGLPSNTTAISATPLTTTASPSNMTSELPPSPLPSSSAIPEPMNPSVMGHVQLNAAMWQQPGIIIGVACSALGFLCIALGLAYHIYHKRNTRRPIRGLRVVSGFDFNGGGEDDYAAFNVWDKPAVGSAAADKAEKGGFEYNGSLTPMSNLRHSTATVYSNADDDDETRRASTLLPSIDEKGIAL